MTAQRTQRVLIADTHPLFAQGVASVLRQDSHLWVMVHDQDPAAITSLDGVDLAVIGFDGLLQQMWLVADRLMRLPRGPLVKFVVLLPGHTDRELSAAASLQASAVLTRSASPQSLRDAVSAVIAGRTMVGPGLAERLLADYSSLIRGRRDAHDTSLSPREREVLELISAGLSNRAIAGALHISEFTVKNHVRRILDKLHASSRLQAVAEANRRGLLSGGLGY